jgi:hypothetical protein
MTLPIDIYVRAGRSRVLARVATSGIYLLRGLPRDLQRAARARAVSEGTTLRAVLLQGLREYAAGTWTPQSDVALPSSAERCEHKEAGRPSTFHPGDLDGQQGSPR